MNATRHWREQLQAWRIPEEILAQAEDSPWVLPRHVFSRRADVLVAEPEGASFPAAWRALDPPGTVLDVGAGAGAASLPLAARSTLITAVDQDEGLLAEFRRRADALGVAAREVQGGWPEVATGVPPADVVVCHHVLYNVPDIVPFLTALTAHARRLVVVELAEAHPLTSLNELWLRFHGIVRPEGPTAGDAVAVLRELGIEPGVSRWRRGRSASAGHPDMATLADVTRRRLCLPRSRQEEVAEALREAGVTSEHDLGSSGDDIVTLTWTP
ncbi:class I SAM-dependent methyltransferase [Prauserella endophytica]|uniref:Methyltransferase domain-containing protein n=1 Tax=Prauserella endophytica TaxID=1592324 RepID=A0ABY2S6U9_9PSEU|nr:methyltransferase domain-containing protein [Prauserella endophytica]PXY30123.1 methyltransferase [Prauserella coralliicola]TKG71191.1 methyltransferase domain-containing protein [Prauserella endophytica]